MFGLGMGEIVVIGLVVVFMFGSKKLPELGKGVGQAIKEFKKAGRELSEDTSNTQDHKNSTPRITDSKHS